MTIPVDIAKLPRVTYSNIRDDFSGVHAVLDEVIARTRTDLLNQDWPNFIGGADSREGTRYAAPCPIDRSLTLGHFWAASPTAIDQGVTPRAPPSRPGAGWDGRAGSMPCSRQRIFSNSANTRPQPPACSKWVNRAWRLLAK